MALGTLVRKTDNKQTHTYNWGDDKMTNATLPSKEMMCLLPRPPSYWSASRPGLQQWTLDETQHSSQPYF